MHNVFVSYKSDDSAQAMKVVSALESSGIPCWIAERDIRPGSNYARDIPAAIRTAKVFILILTEKSQESPWVLKELDAAISQKKVILPLMFGSFTINDAMNFMISGVQYHDATRNLNRTIKQITQQIREITEVTQTEEVSVPVKEQFSASNVGLETARSKANRFAQALKTIVLDGAASPAPEPERFEDDHIATTVTPATQQKELVPADSNTAPITEKNAGSTVESNADTVAQQNAAPVEENDIKCTHCGSTNVYNREEASGCGTILFALLTSAFVVFFAPWILSGLGYDLAMVIGIIAAIPVFFLLIHLFGGSSHEWFCNTCGKIFTPESEEES